MSQLGQYHGLNLPISTITGNAGGPVGPDAAGNINLIGTDPIVVTGNPVTHTETITVATATTAQIGVTYLADNAETIAGIVSTKAVVPSGLAAKLGAQTSNAIPYGNGIGGAIQWTGAGANGQVIIGATGGAPAFANITAGNNIGITNGANTITINVNGTTNHAVQVGNATNSLTSLAVGTDGQVLIGATGANPAFATLTSIGGTIAFTPGANTLNLEAEAAMTGMPWTREVNAAVALAVNHGYINTNVGLTTFTLPALAALGTEIAIMGESAGLWTIAQNAGQNIQFGDTSTTIGVGGSLTATNAFDTIHIVCRIANTTWSVVSAVGNITIV